MAVNQGKTLAIAICRQVGGEIVSVDSRQVYRGIEVLSNAPTASELGGVPCHLVGAVGLEQPMSAAFFAGLARPLLLRLESAGRPAVLTSGTGLYLKVISDGLELGPAPDPGLRQALEADAEADLPALGERLRQLDPVAASRVDRNNPRRVVRALEIHLTGPTTTPLPAPLPAVKVGLHAPLPLLDRWIGERVDRMLEQGALQEVRSLLAGGVNPRSQALRGIGVAEIAAHLRGELGLKERGPRSQMATRACARRQTHLRFR